MRTGKRLQLVTTLVLMFIMIAPTAVFAVGNIGVEGPTAHIVYQHDDEATEDDESTHEDGSTHEEESSHAEAAEETAIQESSSDGVGFTLGFLAAIIALIIFVVAVISAVGLGIIGIGYASVGGNEE